MPDDARVGETRPRETVSTDWNTNANTHAHASAVADAATGQAETLGDAPRAGAMHYPARPEEGEGGEEEEKEEEQPTTTATLSKNALKRQRKVEYRAKMKALKKEQRKEQKAKEREEKKTEVAKRNETMTPEEAERDRAERLERSKAHRAEKIRLKEERLARLERAKEANTVRVVIDFDFEEFMTVRKRRSISTTDGFEDRQGRDFLYSNIPGISTFLLFYSLFHSPSSGTPCRRMRSGASCSRPTLPTARTAKPRCPFISCSRL